MFTEQHFGKRMRMRQIIIPIEWLQAPPGPLTLATAPQAYPVRVRSISMATSCLSFRIDSISVGNIRVAAGICANIELYMMVEVGQDIVVQAENIGTSPADLRMCASGQEIEGWSVQLISENCGGCGSALMHLPGKDAVCPLCV